MEFGVALPGRGPLARPELLLQIATRAEQLRYDSVFVTDHVVLPVSAARSTYPYSPTRQLPGGAAQDYLEPLSMLAWFAHATRRVALGTSVLVIPYRNPLVTAKMLATVDVLSGGRVILGAGVGWLVEEFEALRTEPFEARGRVTDEYLRLMRQTWTTDPVRFQGRYYSLEAVHALPKPRQRDGIPIWIGGHTDAALRRVATLGDAWHPIGLRPPALLHPDEYGAKVKQIHAYAKEAGRDPRHIALTFRVPMDVRSPRAKAPAGDRPLFRGTADEVAGDVRTYAALGVTHFVFDPTSQDVADVLATYERFAREVRPKLGRRASSGARPSSKKPAARRSRR
ncbi:MAG: LLM class F420-dependent oxidoreductase [Candidatus Rokuibacteriota bacterium]